MRKLKAYVRPSLTTLVEFFLNAWPEAQEKWKRVRANNSFQFSAQYTAIVFNILKNNEFEKSRKVLAAKRKSVVQEHGKGNKPQAAQAIDNLRSGSIFVSL